MSGFLIRFFKTFLSPVSSKLCALVSSVSGHTAPALRRAVFQQVLSLCWTNPIIKDGHHHPYIYFEASAELWSMAGALELATSVT